MVTKKSQCGLIRSLLQLQQKPTELLVERSWRLVYVNIKHSDLWCKLGNYGFFVSLFLFIFLTLGIEPRDA